MSTPKYEECLRRELENNATLTNQERMEILKCLAKIETTKLLNQRARIKKGTALPPPREKNRDKLVELPPPVVDTPPAVSMGQQVENILAEMKKAGSEAKNETEEHSDDGSRKLNEQAGPERHQRESVAADQSGT